MVIYQVHIQHIQNYHLAVSKQAPVYLFELPVRKHHAVLTNWAEEPLIVLQNNHCS